MYPILRVLSRTVTIAVLVGVATVGLAASRTLDLLTYTPPEGWNVEERPGGNGNFAVLTKASSTSYCMVAIYPSAPASGDLQASFASEWKFVALKNIDPVPQPAASVRSVGNGQAAIGAAVSKTQGNPVLAMLAVVDADAKVVSVLILSPTVQTFDTYTAEVQALLGSFVVKRIEAPTSASASPPAAPVNDNGRIVIPPPTRVLAVADLAGQWGRSDGINTTYVDRTTGAYAGTESLHTTEKWAITADGKISLDFFGIRNGKKITEKSAGTVGLSRDGILIVRMTNEQKYVVRGWLETNGQTWMKLNGPWYDVIPADVLANPNQGANLDKIWVR